MPASLVPPDADEFHETLAEILTDEIKTNARSLGEALFGRRGPAGHRRVSEEYLLDMASRRWADPMFREYLRTALGDEKFLDVGKKLGYYSPPPSENQILKQLKEFGNA